MTSYIANGKVGELTYMSAYMPLVLDNGKSYILNIPYFAQNDELNLDIIIMVVITVNIAIVMMVLAFILSGLVAGTCYPAFADADDKLKKSWSEGKMRKLFITMPMKSAAWWKNTTIWWISWMKVLCSWQNRKERVPGVKWRGRLLMKLKIR